MRQTSIVSGVPLHRAVAGARGRRSRPGTMITEGRTFMAIARWVSLFPGLAVALTGIAFSVFGDGLADALRVRPR
jgi:peptide/nickel transport system permease protein